MLRTASRHPGALHACAAYFRVATPCEPRSVAPAGSRGSAAPVGTSIAVQEHPDDPETDEHHGDRVHADPVRGEEVPGAVGEPPREVEDHPSEEEERIEREGDLPRARAQRSAIRGNDAGFSSTQNRNARTRNSAVAATSA